MSRSEAAADGAPPGFPLHEAAAIGDLERLRSILSEGTCVDARCVGDCTTLYCAAVRNQLEIAETLLEWGADVNSKQQNDYTPLHAASCHADIELVNMLIRNGACVNEKNQIGQTPLSLAILRNRSRIAELLIEMGADVSARHGIVGTPLHLAVSRNTDMELVKMLLAKGADVNSNDFFLDGFTPLIEAVRSNKLDFTKLLLEWGADVNVGSKTGITLFDFPVSNEVELTIKRHVVKLKSVNVHVGDKLLRTVSQDDEMASFQRECEEEVERLKMENVCSGGPSCFDVLTKNTTRLARLYARNENFLRDLKSVDFDAKFPIYGRILSVRFNAFSGRKVSLERGSELFNVLPRLPQDCILDILDYLSSKDLMNCSEVYYK